MERTTMPSIICKEESPLRNVVEEHCHDEGEDRKPGTSWTPKRDRCGTCTCSTYGKVECHRTVCLAPVGCRKPTMPPGACCPTCADDNDAAAKGEDAGVSVYGINETALSGVGDVRGEPKKCFFDGDKKWHAVGSTWYPYIPPFG